MCSGSKIVLKKRHVGAASALASAAGQTLKVCPVRFHAPPQDAFAGVRTTYARDPDGNVVELQELASRDHPFAVPPRPRAA